MSDDCDHQILPFGAQNNNWQEHQHPAGKARRNTVHSAQRILLPTKTTQDPRGRARCILVHACSPDAHAVATPVMPALLVLTTPPPLFTASSIDCNNSGSVTRACWQPSDNSCNVGSTCANNLSGALFNWLPVVSMAHGPDARARWFNRTLFALLGRGAACCTQQCASVLS